MITVTCDMCGEKIKSPLDEVKVDLTGHDFMTIAGRHFETIERQLCISCATRLVNWIDNQQGKEMI